MNEGEASSSTDISPVKVVQSRQPSSSSSNVSSPHDVVGIWDFESSKLPHRYPIHNLKPHIQKALQQYDPNLVLKKVVAVGPCRGRKYDKINSSSEFEMIQIPRETMFCDMSDCLTPDPVVAGDPSKEQIMRKTDIADKYAMLRMYMEACTTPNILVISSDADFINAIYRMITRGGICVMAAVEERFDLNTQFLHVPKATWIWRSENLNADTMIRNGLGLVCEGYQLPQG